ncbi:YhzD family protein [Bacillus carboniphilus]|uniref:YhzD family protein n=1 Tax=Bacillus carboniphilus TaxID=86663 RepID=A0ABY9JTU4_9BACI|nr:YhzD family protein [Bacillus carboniphilus]WLR42831.1 YhzD family protein [Bacillus carboniphilus]
METYYLTVFSKDGEKLLDETFQAEDEKIAKLKGEDLLQEKGFSEHTHRCTTSKGKMILFHR